jgi:hypothetical protein
VTNNTPELLGRPNAAEREEIAMRARRGTDNVWSTREPLRWADNLTPKAERQKAKAGGKRKRSDDRSEPFQAGITHHPPAPTHDARGRPFVKLCRDCLTLPVDGDSAARCTFCQHRWERRGGAERTANRNWTPVVGNGRPPDRHDPRRQLRRGRLADAVAQAWAAEHGAELDRMARGRVDGAKLSEVVTLDDLRATWDSRPPLPEPVPDADRCENSGCPGRGHRRRKVHGVSMRLCERCRKQFGRTGQLPTERLNARQRARQGDISV